MEFVEFDFVGLNEQDIREEIIAPLLRELGYRSGTPNNIIREQTLAYSKAYLGRKKSTDPDLKGRADYIVEAENNVRWIIEAKSPVSDINTDDIQQAWTYANHPEVRAVYFVLSNGIDFLVYQTNKGPQNPAILQSSYAELPEKLALIKNILSPASIVRDFKDVDLDFEPPIGDGLRSIAKIVNGHIVFHHNSLGMQHMKGLTLSVKSGFLQRNEENNIVAYLDTVSPFIQLQKLNEKFGLHEITAVSGISVLSSYPNNMSELVYNTSNILPQGESILDLATMNTMLLPQNITVNTETHVAGYLENNEFKGSFNAQMHFVGSMPVSLEGEFCIVLA